MKLKARTCDAPPNSFKDPNVGSIVKQWKKKRVEARFIARNTLRIGARVPIWE
jgi:hypothetical protein